MREPRHNTFMPKHLLRRYLPNPSSLRAHPALKPVRKWLQDPEIWHMNRRAVAGAAFIGFFCAFLPIPFQMVVAAALAITFRCNLPIASVLVWITNPITLAPMFYFAYRLGVWLLGSAEVVSEIQLDWDWLLSNIDDLAYPLLFGSLVCGWVAGVTAYAAVHLLWRLHVLGRWRERRARRARRKGQPVASPAQQDSGYDR